MKGFIALVLLALVAGVCCQTNMFILRSDRPQLSSSSSEDRSEEKTLSNHNVGLSNTENLEYIRSVDIFKAKVNQRLNASVLLANHPDVKGRLMNIAVHKYKLCGTSNNVLPSRGSCLGVATAQMMSLIRNMERNSSLQLPDLP